MNSYANYTGKDLSGKEYDFSRAWGYCSDFSDSKLTDGIKFIEAELENTDFSNSDIDADFTNCTLLDGGFNKSRLWKVIFNNSKLTNINFTDSYFNHADFSNATLTRCEFENIYEHGTIIFNNTTFKDCIFYDVMFGDVKFDNCKFDNCKFKNSTITLTTL